MVLPKNDTHVNLRIPVDLHAKAVAVANAEHRALSSWVRHLIMRELADKEAGAPDAS